MSESLYVCPRMLERDARHAKWGNDLSDDERRELRHDAEIGGKKHGDGHTAVHFIYTEQSHRWEDHPEQVTRCDKCGAPLVRTQNRIQEA